MKFNYSSGKLAVLLALTLTCAGLTGCVIGSTNSTNITGHVISPTTFAQIEPSKSRDFVVALIGEPSEKTKIDNGGEIWKWHYSERHETNTNLIFILGAHNETKVEKTNYVEFKDGVVVRTWTE